MAGDGLRRHEGGGDGGGGGVGARGLQLCRDVAGVQGEGAVVLLGDVPAGDTQALLLGE